MNSFLLSFLINLFVMHTVCILSTFISGETDAAKAMLTHCLDQDPTFSDAHLLMAQVSYRLSDTEIF